MTFKEIAPRLNDLGGPVIGRGEVNPRGVGASFASSIADVEVDLDTGKIEVLRFTSIQDVGKAIHPSYVEGQIQGAAVQGIGWALNEEYFMGENGSLVNSSLLDYRMPTSLDVPTIETELVEVPNPGHPFGVRGVGEACIVPPLPAMVNAVYDAIGIRMDALPMSPGAVQKALNDAGKS
jgi:CO/xanthine dehydrogenase Mo-binding subunit